MTATRAGTPAIFISYRRDDSEGYAGRLYKDLAEHFGPERVFMDVAGIEPGRDFRRVIEEQVASCVVLLALIGREWLDARDEAGRRRLDDPGDFVRLETAAALRRDIPVVPVLVQGAHMPRLDQLPEELKPLAYRNAVELTHPRWESDLQLLINALTPYMGGFAAAPVANAGAPRARRSRRLAAAALTVLAALGVAWGGWQAWQRERGRSAQAEQALRQEAQAAREQAERVERERRAELETERAARLAAAAQASAAAEREALARREKVLAAAEAERLRKEQTLARQERDRLAREQDELRRREQAASAAAAAAVGAAPPAPASGPALPPSQALATATPSRAAPPATAASGRHLLRPTRAGDEAVILGVSPPAGTVLKAGRYMPIRFRLKVRLVSRDRAWVTVALLQSDSRVTRCDDPAASMGHATDGGRTRVTRGDQEVTVTVDWRGGVPMPGAERRGLLLPNVNLWEVADTTPLGPRIAYLGYAPEACLAFAP